LWAGDGLFDPDAVPLSSGTIPSWKASWVASVCFTLRARGNLGPFGPRSSTVSTVLPFLKVLLGSGRFEVFGAWSEKSDGAAVAGLHHFVDSPLSSFLFVWACFVVAPAFSVFGTLILMWLLYKI
jgi:hypothetical protein